MFQSIRTLLTGKTDAERRIEADIKNNLDVIKELVEARSETQKGLRGVDARIRLLERAAGPFKGEKVPDILRQARGVVEEERKALLGNLTKLDVIKVQWEQARKCSNAIESIRQCERTLPIDLSKEHIGSTERMAKAMAGRSHKDFIREIREVKEDSRKRSDP